jgi:O-antigen/teichoic acid export membrane protein
MARLLRGVLGSGGVWVLRLGVTLGTAFLFGHLLGPAGYGDYATVVAHVTLFAPMCSLGYDMLATREFVAARAAGDVAQEAALAHTLPRAVWRTTGLMLLLFVPVSLAYQAFRGRGWPVRSCSRQWALR